MSTVTSFAAHHLPADYHRTMVPESPHAPSVGRSDEGFDLAQALLNLQEEIRFVGGSVSEAEQDLEVAASDMSRTPSFESPEVAPRVIVDLPSHGEGHGKAMPSGKAKRKRNESGATFDSESVEGHETPLSPVRAKKARKTRGVSGGSSADGSKGKASESAWGLEESASLARAFEAIPECKRDSVSMMGKRWGRNETIALWVTLETGQFVGRKRVSSKKQSLGLIVEKKSPIISPRFARMILCAHWVLTGQRLADNFPLDQLESVPAVVVAWNGRSWLLPEALRRAAYALKAASGTASATCSAAPLELADPRCAQVFKAGNHLDAFDAAPVNA